MNSVKLPERMAEQNSGCINCGSPLHRKPGERKRDFAARRSCDKKCHAAFYGRRYVSTHEMLLSNSTLGPGCWEWTQYVDPNGYGRSALNDGEVLVHRISYREFNGPITDGLHVLHSCDNRKCINPEHLWLGTNDDNIADRMEKGRSARNGGEANGRAILTQQDVESIRKDGRSQSDIAQAYGVHQTTISAVQRRSTWISDEAARDGR